MSLIAASIAVHEAADVEESIERAVEAARSGAQLVEWRVDSLPDQENGLNAARELVRRSPVPCIVTCRAEFEGGDYRGDEPTRAAFLEEIINADVRPRYVDVELAAFERDAESWKGFCARLGELRGRADLSASLIMSAHDFDGRPRRLLQMIERMTNDPLCSIIKVAWHARSLRDNLEAFDLLRDRHKPMIALCMGPFGLLSRVLAPKFGGFLTFAVDREAEVTGPGQPTIEDLVKLYRFGQITAATRVYGVIGWPVSHSQSPAIHNAGFEAVGFDGVYLPLPIPPEFEHFKATVGAMIDHSGLNFRGASVTIPHKENLLRFVRDRGGRVEAMSERIGAANTLVVGSAGGLECLNTDCPAAIDSLCAGMGIDRSQLRGQRVAVIGAGGVARAVVAGLAAAGAQVSIFNRTFDTAARLAAEFQNQAFERGAEGRFEGGSVQAEPMENVSRERFDVFINCTPIGMLGGPAPNDSPLPGDVALDETVTVMDTVYTPVRTPLVREAEARGARVIPGMDMFVRQAALQFEIWTGVPGPIETFKSALRRMS